jgi:uncharacterized protein YbcI
LSSWCPPTSSQNTRSAAEFIEAVERLTGAKVVAFISGNNIDPDVACELFILDASLAHMTPPA